MRKRIISAALALCMVLALLPVGAWAEDGSDAIITVNDTNELLDFLNSVPNAKATSVNGSEIQLSARDGGEVVISKALHINCDVAIDLNCALNLGENYIQVDSQHKVEIAGTGAGSIQSTNRVSALVAMRGSTLSISRVEIRMVKSASGAYGYGVMVSAAPADAASEPTELHLSNMVINGGEGGVYVNGNIQNGSAPVLNLDQVQITPDSPDSAGLYLAGMANTTIKNSSYIYGTIGIGIKAGTLNVGESVTIHGTGAYREPSAFGNGIYGDGSAILVENNASYAGNVDITIGEGASLRSKNSYAIREFTAENWSSSTKAAPKITINSGELKGFVESSSEANPPIDIDQAQLTISGDAWQVLPVEPQPIEVSAAATMQRPMRRPG